MLDHNNYNNNKFHAIEKIKLLLSLCHSGNLTFKLATYLIPLFLVFHIPNDAAPQFLLKLTFGS